MACATVQLHRSITLEATPEQLWPLLSDTDRVNRLVHLPASEHILPEADLSRLIRAHMLGVPVMWREYPFEWVFGQWFEITRTFARPLPIRQIRTGTRLDELPSGGTKVEVFVNLVADNPAIGFASRLVVGQKMLRDLLRVYRQFDHAARTSQETFATQRPAVHRHRLQRGLDQLHKAGLPAPVIERLRQHLRSADDREVLRMRPFALADQWRKPRLDVLRVFLYATRTGLLDLEWAVMCPSCRGASVCAPTLQDVHPEAHCPSCQIRYDVNFDEAVELRFSVNPSVRTALDTTYCIGGPANTRHIVAQVWVPAHGARELRVQLHEGAYLLRSRQTASSATLDVQPSGAHTARVLLDATNFETELVTLGAGDVDITFENMTDTNLLIALEQSAWNAQATSAAMVTTLAEFRQLFASEVLAPGVGVGVRKLTFMFSDLLNSTHLYDTLGDALAYASVRDHFSVMQRIIEQHHGALVKTIGDAVMAVFQGAEDAVEASIAIQREFTQGKIARGHPALHIKLGLHTGPCIAVNANDVLDYFGSTVNVAARVQEQSCGGDIVITAELCHDSSVQRVLERAEPVIEPFQRSLKGISQAFTLYRLWPAQQAARSEHDGDTLERAVNGI